MTFFHAILLGLIEGMTEFLPISSTGHMILASSVLGISDSEFVKTFEVFIQLGAIAAIVLMYARRYITSLSMYQRLLIAFIPTALIGFALYDVIKTTLFNPVVVSISLIIGGVVLILVDRLSAFQTEKETPLTELSLQNAGLIGLIQALSVIPGVSRAAATIIGGMSRGLSKKSAMEFSFLLAVPTMIAASGFDLLKTDLSFTGNELMLLGAGFVMAFVSAWFAVKLFIHFVEQRGFTFFGVYRIALGVIFLLYYWR